MEKKDKEAQEAAAQSEPKRRKRKGIRKECTCTPKIYRNTDTLEVLRDVCTSREYWTDLADTMMRAEGGS